MKKLEPSGNSKSNTKLFSSTNKQFKFYVYKLNKFFSSINFSQDSFLLILGGITGILGGIGAIVFHEAIHFIEHTFFVSPGHLFGGDSLLNINTIPASIFVILIPAIGGLLVGLLSHYFEKGEKGEGIPNVITAVASKGGVIKGNIAIKKIIGAGLSIGTGGAGGKEGPIVQIGAAMASYFGRLLNLSHDRLRILVGCGAAAGLSAAFNAPLGGAIFAMEIILRTFRAKTFSPIIVASVFATALSHSYLGDKPVFRMDDYQLNSNYEIGLYIALGLVCGLAAVYFVKVFYLIEDGFAKVKIHPIVKPAFGGLLVGIIGLYLPGVYGFSYDAMTGVLTNNLPLIVVIALLLIKPIATAFTIGSGGNGGTFAPSLFMGAMVGGAFGQLAHYMFPEISLQPGAYALVGMAGVVAGTTHASLTALIMTFEMTNNYKIILPLMLTIIISTTLSKSFLKGSLYTIKFIREGKAIDIYGREIDILKNLKVINLLDKNYNSVYDDIKFTDVVEELKNARFNTILVKSRDEKVVGQISFHNLRNVVMDEEYRQIRDFLVARDVMTDNYATVHEQENGEEALRIIESGDFEYLPVLSRDDRSVMGIISRRDLLNRYQKELLIRQNTPEMEIG